MKKKTLLKIVCFSLLMLAGGLFTTQAKAAAASYCGVLAPASNWHGHNSDCLSGQNYNALTGLSGGSDSLKSQFISDMHGFENGQGPQKVGAKYIEDMLGGRSTNTPNGKPIWENLINGSNIKLSLESYSTCSNTAYDPGSNQDIPVTECGIFDVLRIKQGNSSVYIKKDCGNPVGDLSGISNTPPTGQIKYIGCPGTGGVVVGATDPDSPHTQDGDGNAAWVEINYNGTTILGPAQAYEDGTTDITKPPWINGVNNYQFDGGAWQNFVNAHPNQTVNINLWAKDNETGAWTHVDSQDFDTSSCSPPAQTNHDPTGSLSTSCSNGTGTVTGTFGDADGATQAYLKNGSTQLSTVSSSPGTWTINGLSSDSASVTLWVKDVGSQSDGKFHQEDSATMGPCPTNQGTKGLTDKTTPPQCSNGVVTQPVIDISAYDTASQSSHFDVRVNTNGGVTWTDLGAANATETWQSGYPGTGPPEYTHGYVYQPSGYAGNTSVAAQTFTFAMYTSSGSDTGLRDIVNLGAFNCGNPSQNLYCQIVLPPGGDPTQGQMSASTTDANTPFTLTTVLYANGNSQPNTIGGLVVIFNSSGQVVNDKNGDGTGEDVTYTWGSIAAGYWEGQVDTSEVLQAGTYNVVWGASLNGSGVTCHAQFTLSAPAFSGQKPYFNVYGGDVAVGSGSEDASGSVGSRRGCAATINNAGIHSWNQTGDGDNSSYQGGGTQFGAMALGVIEGFASNQEGMSNVGNLTFAQGGSPTTGGNFGSAPDCLHFLDGESSSYPDPADTPGKVSDLSSLATGNYFHNGNLTIGGSGSNGIADGKHITIYVKGDVTVTGRIDYQTPNNANGWGSVADIPSLTIVADDGNINFEWYVTTVTGTFVADGAGADGKGVINTCNNDFAPGGAPLSSNLYLAQLGLYCNAPIHVYGSFVAREVDLTRAAYDVSNANGDSLVNAAGGGGNSAAEEFIYSPEDWLPAMGSGGGGLSPGYDAITSLPPIL